MLFSDMFLTRGRLSLTSFLCFVGGFSMGSWFTLFHQLQLERDLMENDMQVVGHNHEPILLLAVLIITAPENFGRRDTLRSTWLQLNPSSKTVKHFFVIGTEGLSTDVNRRIQQEQTVKNDLVLISDLKDSYGNLTVKVMQSFVHLSSLTPFQYILKCDDDSFARIDAIASELEERQLEISRNRHSSPGGDDKRTSKCFYWGFFDGRARAKKKGKWQENDYNICDLYIPYALGGGYILDKRCSDFIVQNHNTLHSYYNEDVTIGTWLSVISTERKHDVRFDTEYESRGCSNKYLIQHKLTEAEMVERYKNLVTNGKLCTQEVKHRGSYEYDWQGLPSQCCKRSSSII